MLSPGLGHSNVDDVMHGGALLGFLDVAFFAGAHAAAVEGGFRAVTVDLSVQFLAPATLDAPLDLVVEVLRETRRMAFLRGVIEQAGELRLAASATIRKPSA
jgi:uncharacterized protein (TIGR00369 family)